MFIKNIETCLPEFSFRFVRSSVSNVSLELKWSLSYLFMENILVGIRD